MKRVVVAGLTAVALLAAVNGYANGEEAKRQYIGAAKCKMCHNSEAQGKIFDVWMASKHSQAFTALGTDAAKKLGAAKGIADPQTADACLKCHVTGHGAKAEMLGPKYAATEGVTCESCHGAGSDYWKMDVMKAVKAGTTKGADVGLVTKPDEATCKGCHNAESPTFKSFDFKEYWPKIKHAIPAAAVK
jgi:cytochrome c554/c'-like protein